MRRAACSNASDVGDDGDGGWEEGRNAREVLLARSSLRKTKTVCISASGRRRLRVDDVTGLNVTGLLERGYRLLG